MPQISLTSFLDTLSKLGAWEYNIVYEGKVMKKCATIRKGLWSLFMTYTYIWFNFISELVRAITIPIAREKALTFKSA